MRNLLKDVEWVLRLHHKTLDDVRLFAGAEFQITKENFLKCAAVDYEFQEIAFDLKLIGDNWWMDRRSDDGGDYWDYHEFPDVSSLPVEKVRRLTGKDDGRWWVLSQFKFRKRGKKSSRR